MRNTRIKLFAIIFLALPFLLLTLFEATPVKVAALTPEEPAVTYKAKCAMCHSPKADKFYDVTKAEEMHVQAILKGVKGEKPPYMPGFEAKGMTELEAKGLAEFMKSLRTPAK